MKLVVVTASTNPLRALSCLKSWGNIPTIIVCNGCEPLVDHPDLANVTWVVNKDYLGTVPAFRRGVDFALDHTDADVIACLHDDLELLDADWGAKVLRAFERRPACGLAGFGGALGLGSDDLYKAPYHPMQLARSGFRSNLVDADVHGIRSLLAEQVAALDGFSQIGRREFFQGLRMSHAGLAVDGPIERPWTVMEDLGVVHHCYDAMIACLAARYGWQTWYLPIRCRHYGGQTAVGDAGYQSWAKTKIPDGDMGFWQFAHKICHQNFNDVLPIRV